MLKFFDAVSKTAVISFVSYSSTQQQNHNVQLELLQHHINFHPDQLKSVQEIMYRGFALH